MGERSRYSRADLARMIGSTTKTVAAWSKMPSFPAADSRDLIDGVDFMLWWFEKKATKGVRDDLSRRLGVAVPEQDQQTPEDDFVNRRARAKAMLEELNLAREQKTLVRISDLQQHIETLIRCLRSGCDVLQRRFGTEAAEILERSIAEAEIEIGRIAS